MLPNLVKMSLRIFKNCEHLPPLGQLPFLKSFTLNGMDAVRCLSNDFYSEGMAVVFPSLETPHLFRMRNLEEWLNFHERRVMPCLTDLQILSCPKLANMPWFSSVKNVTFYESNEMILRSAANLTSISSLHISGCPDLLSLPEGLLKNNIHLQSLRIWDCPRLQILPEELQNLTSLNNLEIVRCI